MGFEDLLGRLFAKALGQEHGPDGCAIQVPRGDATGGHIERPLGLFEERRQEPPQIFELGVERCRGPLRRALGEEAVEVCVVGVLDGVKQLVRDDGANALFGGGIAAAKLGLDEHEAGAHLGLARGLAALGHRLAIATAKLHQVDVYLGIAAYLGAGAGVVGHGHAKALGLVATKRVVGHLLDARHVFGDAGGARRGCPNRRGSVECIVHTDAGSVGNLYRGGSVGIARRASGIRWTSALRVRVAGNEPKGQGEAQRTNRPRAHHSAATLITKRPPVSPSPPSGLP